MFQGCSSCIVEYVGHLGEIQKYRGSYKFLSAFDRHAAPSARARAMSSSVTADMPEGLRESLESWLRGLRQRTAAREEREI